MTPEMEQAIAEIAEQTGLSNADLRALAEASESDLALLLRAYQDAGVIASVSTFDQIVAGLTVAANLANLVLPIVGAAQSLRTLFTP
jgi:hypothetical protein